MTDLSVFYQSLFAIALIIILGIILGKKRLITAPISEVFAGTPTLRRHALRSFFRLSPHF
jgi:hypothetical protein